MSCTSITGSYVYLSVFESRYRLSVVELNSQTSKSPELRLPSRNCQISSARQAVARTGPIFRCSIVRSESRFSSECPCTASIRGPHAPLCTLIILRKLVHDLRVPCSVLVSAEISVRSLQTLFILILQNSIYGTKVSEKHFV